MKHLAWISDDYFESLLLPQWLKTTRGNRVKFRQWRPAICSSKLTNVNRNIETVSCSIDWWQFKNYWLKIACSEDLWFSPGAQWADLERRSALKRQVKSVRSKLYAVKRPIKRALKDSSRKKITAIGWGNLFFDSLPHFSDSGTTAGRTCQSSRLTLILACVQTSPISFVARGKGTSA